MISPPSPLRVLAITTDPPKLIQIDSKTRDQSGSDLSTSVVSNDSSIFDSITMSDASSIPSDTEDNEVDHKYPPPRISSKTYMQQTTETIEEDPDEDSENGNQIVGDSTRPTAQVTKATHSSRPTTPPRRPPNMQINDDDKPIEIKPYRYVGNLAVANGHIGTEKSSESGNVTPAASSSVTPTTPLTSAKREKSFFHLPKLNRSKSQVTLPAEAKSHSLKDQIKNVFHSANNSTVTTPPDSQPTSVPGTPHVEIQQPSPQQSPQISPVTQSTVPPTRPGPRRVASVGPNMMLAGSNTVSNLHPKKVNNPPSVPVKKQLKVVDQDQFLILQQHRESSVRKHSKNVVSQVVVNTLVKVQHQPSHVVLPMENSSR